MIRTNEIAAIVVTYNCKAEELIRSIETYRQFVGCIYVCDNSDNDKLNSFFKCNNVDDLKYLSMNGNMGIAYALNRGCVTALNNGYKWVLTMDQDSHFATDIKGYIAAYNDYHDTAVALLCPHYQYHDESFINDAAIVRKPSVITKSIQSGCLLSLDAFKAVGEYEEKYFIDYVDYEYCMRLASHGYLILQVPSVILKHKRGSICSRKLFGHEYTFACSTPIRVYYQTRNSIDYYIKYRDYHDLLDRFLIMTRMVLMEHNRFTKLKYAFEGIIDYFRGKWYKR